jgi:PAS domain S-box-containing protein
MLIAWGDELIALYNQAHAALIGDHHPATFGRPLFAVWNEASTLVAVRFREALRGHASRSDGMAIPITRGGRSVSAYFDVSYTPIPDGDGFGGVLCLSTETTVNVLAELRKAVLLELSDRSRGVENPNRIVLAAVETLGRTLKASRVGYGEVQADGQNILLDASYVDGVGALSGLFPLESFGLGTVAAHLRGEIVAHDDVHHMPDRRDTWSAIDTRAFVSVPLIRDGRFRASLYVNFREPHIWSPDEIALIEETADRIWDSLERARAEEELRLSEARFRAAVSAVQGVLWTNNADGKMEGEQIGWAALTGQTIGEYQGYGWAAAVHPDDAQPTVAAWREAVEARRPFVFEHRVRNRDGAWRNFSIRAIPIVESGQIREWVGVHTDITEQRRAEEDLRRSNVALKARIDQERALNERLIAQDEELRRAQKSLSAIFRASSEGLTLCRLMTDQSGRAFDYQVIDVNPAHRELTGATREQMLAKPVSQVAPPFDPVWISSAEKAVRSGKPQAFEVQSPATGRWLDIRVSPVGGDLFAQTFIDVTSRHRAENERRRLLEEMNHRVMNNFQIVAAVLQLQARRAASAEVKNALQTAVRRVSSLSELHQSLATSPDSVRVDVGLYLTTVCDKLRATIPDPTRIVLKVSACNAQLDSAVAVPLGFVVNELVTNAIKYAFPEPASGAIDVAFEPDGDRGYRLTIADSGQGLPAVLDTKGTGLGMRLVHAFVAQIDGDLTVQHDSGVSYRISVPAAQPELDRTTGLSIRVQLRPPFRVQY